MERFIVIGALAALAAAAPVLGQSVTVSLPVRGTFLRANQDTVTAPVVRTLASLGIAPGDLIRISVHGEYEYNASHAISRNSVAVFSASATLLASNIVQRVPDAIEAGVDFVSAPTYRGGLATDFPQDFQIGNGPGSLDPLVVVPAGATHLFLGIYDSLYEDNADTDADFAAEVTLVCAGNVCCGTADFDGDGDFGTDFDIQAFFACLGGNCCATCYANGSDFNADGDFGTDADIESFFRVLSGGPC